MLFRSRDLLVHRIAESMAEQRALWTLLGESSATLCYPSLLTQADARTTLRAILIHARRHHRTWFVIDLVLLTASLILSVIPGPNVIAYYFVFRVVGHLQSWRGARDGLDRVVWTAEGNDGLAELVALVDAPRGERRPRVEAIDASLNAPRLSAFFDRIAAPSQVNYDHGAS